MGDIIRNKRTSICALIVACAAIVRIFFPSEEAFINKMTEAIVGLVGALALFFAKDGNNTGTVDKPRY